MGKKKRSKTPPPPNYLKAWRVFRKMTQEALADAVGTSKGVISDLEHSNRGLSHKWAVRLAPALQTSPGFLLDHDPNNLPTSILDLWAAIPDDRKPLAEDILRNFAKRA